MTDTLDRAASPMPAPETADARPSEPPPRPQSPAQPSARGRGATRSAATGARAPTAPRSAPEAAATVVDRSLGERSPAGETWLVLGGSSAVARAFAREAARHGCGIVLAGRDLADLERSAADLRARFAVPAEALAFDATDFAGHATFAAACRSGGGRLNVFLAFAVMPSQGELDRDPARVRSVIDANLTGAVSVLLALAPILEAQGAGRVVALGSVAGDRGRLKNYVYGATKAGLHAFLQGLRARLARSGVTVTTVKPGFLDTALTWGLPGLILETAPDDFARTVWRRVERGALVVYVPGFWWAIMGLLRLLPERLFIRLPI